MVDFAKFKELEDAGDRYAANRLLFKWLCDDADRASLYRYLRVHHPVLSFQSRADVKERPADASDSVFHQDVYLLTKREHIERALADSENFSNAPYRVLGSGTFMLELDATVRDKQRAHDTQRAFASAFLHYDETTIKALCELAFKAAAVLPLKQSSFDIAELAEQAALRFVGFLFGFAQADHVDIQSAARAAYLGLNYQILGRHFVTEPGIVPAAIQGTGGLLQRAAYLIDLYREAIGREQDDQIETLDDELKEIRDYKDRNGTQPLREFVPLLRRIATQAQSGYSGTELAVIVVGLIAGTVGNVQASVAIAMKELFADSKQHEAIREEAYRSWEGNPDEDKKLRARVWKALRLNPPVAFLPRQTNSAFELGGVNIEPNSVLILAIGAATRFETDSDPAKESEYGPLIFGGPPRGGHVHQCIGEHLATPLFMHIIRQTLLLPGLRQALDPRTGAPLGLEKRWGFGCVKYPLEFDRVEILRPSVLNVVMQVKRPISDHAEALKKVITYGAPRIEKKLRDARHVHFAWFEFIENDNKLVLHTVYDRDFEAYIEHFALQIGALFDLLFEHIEDAPPRPVKKFSKEFVDRIRRYNRAPAGDYFFSAYPRTEVAMIMRQFREGNA